MPVTNPHDTIRPSYTCEACTPPVTIYADTQKALDKLVTAHNTEYHNA